MIKSILQELSISYHYIKGNKFGVSLIVWDYDYFLNKRDIKLIRKNYQKIYLVKESDCDKALLIEKIQKEIDSVGQVDLISPTPFVSNLEYGERIRLKDTNSFCEELLSKSYVPKSMELSVPDLDNLATSNNGLLFLKEVLDFLAALLILFLTIPLWLVSFVVIPMQTKGGYFYIQERMGKYGKLFNVFKFRSMYLDAEKNGAQFSKKNDNRIYPYGRIMRKTRIDELPQIFNILRGELSLIGPRPEREFWIDTFKVTIPYYDKRHLVKPGITGYAQVMYPYGSNENDSRHKLMYDLYYVKNWSISLETKILFKTLVTIFGRGGV